MRYLRRAFILLCLLTVIITAGGIRAQDEYVADMGFRPADNGFSFQNYTKGYEGITAIEMERLFGDVVCYDDERDEDGACTLTSPASMWMDDRNQRILGGHCEGMASLSLSLYGEIQDPETFGGEETNELALDDNPDLQREIAYHWATWGNSPSITNFDVPSALINILVDSMNSQDEAYTLDIYMPDWTKGHAVTPYAIADQGDGIVLIMVYDNNWPGEERYVQVDTNNETWSYAASTNPENTEYLYQGDGNTKTMGLTPVSSRLEVHACPFCGDADSEGGDEEYTGVVINGNGVNSTVTDSEGHVTGMVNGKFVNDIPGAQVQHPLYGNIDGQFAPLVFIPSKTKFRVSISKGNMQDGDKQASISLVRNGVVTRVSGVNLDDQEDFVDVDSNRISYTSGSGGETPEFEQGMMTSGNDYHYEITGKSDIGDDGTLDFSYDPATGEFNIGGSADNEYIVDVDRIDEHGNIQNFYTDNLDVSGGDTANLDAGTWEEGGDITGEIVNPDGSIDGEINLDDEEAPEEIITDENGQTNPDEIDTDTEMSTADPADTDTDTSTDAETDGGDSAETAPDTDSSGDQDTGTQTDTSTDESQDTGG